MEAMPKYSAAASVFASINHFLKICKHSLASGLLNIFHSFFMNFLPKMCAEFLSWARQCGVQKTEFGMKDMPLWLCVCDSRIVMSNSLKHQGLDPARFLCPWNSPDENTGVDCHFLLQGIFPIQGLNPGVLASLVSQTVKNLPAMRETWI